LLGHDFLLLGQDWESGPGKKFPPASTLTPSKGASFKTSAAAQPTGKSWTWNQGQVPSGPEESACAPAGLVLAMLNAIFMPRG